ncbi:Rossmann fold nucleotide-binding protein [Nocardioides panaciterrulae]|uniref:Putative Rossmann-fold nucleotide-binding protein n=1 Tax=Nocardioides panaciterrulae TaxID=661492 RepID=A0A7Y9JAZ3_9ACTN|nr:putative Rossmann-fold nucleotide-binding protein [Nocardioides panaciterrulae]
MRRTRGRQVEIDSLEDFDRRLARGTTRLSGWWVHGVDLSGRTEQLAACDVAGASFLACTFADGDAERIEGRGAIVFPALPGVPVDPYRSRLYTAGELFDERPYAASLDARAYAWSRGPQAPRAMLARALHDHAIDEALTAWVGDRRLVGVMGGHALERDDTGYADAARLGRLLAAGHTVTTGGGPGAMEAANLGARLADRTEDEHGQALSELATVPSYHPTIGAWADIALDVLEKWPGETETLGIPTWFYGHEPPNVFATAIAKYFRNATREAILVQVCDAGIVFLPGVGGTVQEVFQDGCENFYADESSVAPMVLVGRRYWTETVPAWPLLRSLARGRPMEPHAHLVDTVDEAADLVESTTAGAGRP